MRDLAILFQQATMPVTAYESLLGRATRARRIALMLSRHDAEVVEAYADECEAEAKRLVETRRARVAA